MSLNKSFGDFNTLAGDTGRGKTQSFPDGSRLGEYLIIRLLGRGGMGEVYEVEHSTLGKRYALKLLPSDFASSPGALNRFRREAHVMANLEHPNIIKVDEFGETSGRYWLRMELVRGVEVSADLAAGSLRSPSASNNSAFSAKDLASYQAGGKIAVTLAKFAELSGGRIDQVVFAPILRQVLEAMSYAHSRDVVHRDLKPSNILLEELQSGRGTRLRQDATPGQAKAQSNTSFPALNSKISADDRQPTTNDFLIKISDFGLVRLVGEEWIRSQVEISVKHSMTMGDMRTIGAGSQGASTKSLIGTYEYMSPEQKRGEDADKRSDVYALGLMCYRLLTGRNLSMKKPSAIIPSLVSGLDDFIAKAVEEEVGERFADAGAMLEDFKKIIYADSTTKAQSHEVGIGEAETGRKTDDGGQKADDGKTSNQRAVVSNQTTDDQRLAFAKVAEGRPTTDESLSSLRRPGAKGKNLKVALVATVLLCLSIFVFWQWNNYSKNKAETERISKLESEKKVKISDLLAKGRTDFDTKRYVEASDVVRQVLEIDKNNSAAEKLNKDISAAVGLSQAAPLKSSAEIKYAQLANIDKGQGVGAIIENANVAMNTAKTLSDRKSYGEAMGKYKEVISFSENVLKLDGERKTATEKRVQCDSARTSAEKSNASINAVELWKSAKESDGKAVEKFNSGDFVKASELWARALDEYAKADTDHLHWDRVSSAWKTEILQRVEKDGLILNGKKYKADITQLFKDYAPEPNGICAYGGGMYFRFSREELLLRKCFNLLSVIYENSENVFAKVIKLLNNQNALSIADEKFISDWLSAQLGSEKIIVTKILMRKPDVAQKYLETYGQGQQFRRLIICAKIWFSVFNDIDKARQCLVKAEGLVKSSSDWTSCADSWFSNFNDIGKARQCLEKAGELAKRSSDWTSCANSWFSNFNDKGKARQCLVKAEELAKRSFDWTFCADSWFTIFSDKGKAGQCLVKAEELAKSSFDWTFCADSWFSNFNDIGKARKYLVKAEEQAKSSFDWTLCVDSWYSNLNDTDKARQCLIKAEEQANSSWDWTRCTNYWLANFNDMTKARQYMVKAEEVAKSSWDWTTCAHAWYSNFNDTAKTRQCLVKAEEVAKSSFDWSWCANGWLSNFNDTDKTKQYMLKAEEVAKSSSDWTTCADGWYSNFNDTAKTRQLLLKAEEVAKSSSDWTSCANGWLSNFNDVDKARQCLTKAEEQAKYFFDWKSCIKAWLDNFNDIDKARQCMVKSEGQAKNSLDWKLCAGEWFSVFNDIGKARQCLVKAEELAKRSFDWKFCAEGWFSIFNDIGKARQCMVKAEELAKSSLDWKVCAEGWFSIFSDMGKARQCMVKAEELAKKSSDWKFCAEGWEKLGDVERAKQCRDKEKMENASLKSTPAALPINSVDKTEKLYTVKSGDSVWKVAQIHGVGKEELAAYNKLSLQKPLTTGQVLKIPTGATMSLNPSRPVPGTDWTIPDIGMEFVWIKVLDCWVGKYEVTNGEYRKFKAAHDSKDYKDISLNGDRQPVVFVNFDDATEYAKWLTERERKTGRIPTGYCYRLPSEKEWTGFCRCGDSREYPWGNGMPPKYGNYCGQETKGIANSMIPGWSDDYIVTCSVEKSGKNDWGLYGVGGNVWECTIKSSSDFSFDAWRGASWSYKLPFVLRCLVQEDMARARQGSYDPIYLGSSYRLSIKASSSSEDLGFRLVLSRTSP